MGGWVIALLGVAASLVGAIYVFQVVWPRFRDMVLGPQDDVGVRTRSLLARYKEGEGAAAAQNKGLELRFLRTAHDEGEAVLLFVAEAGPAMNLSVQLSDGMKGAIEPASLLEQRQSGSIRLPGSDGADPGLVPFVIAYEDAKGMRRKRRYVYRATHGDVVDPDEEAGL